MKRLFIYMILPLLCMGCEDFLDTENLTKKDNTSFPRTPEDAEAVLNGTYSLLRETDGLSSFMTSELLSDDRFGGGGPDDKRMHAVDHLMKVDENMFGSVWKINYKGIYRSNDLLENMDKITWKNAQQRDKIEGQTRFLRAYYYFDLCRMFGAVPLTTSTEPVNKPRAEIDELYALIASDLKTAIEKLPAQKYNPEENSELGRATKWAAEGLLARVYLFYTGYYKKDNLPLSKTQSLSKSDVIAYLDDCIGNSGHDLVSDFRNLWPYGNQYTKKDYPYAKDNDLNWIGESGENVETVFAIKFSSKANWDYPNYNNELCLYSSLREPASAENIFPFGIGWGIGTVNSQIWKDWPEKDVRREASVLSVEKELPNYGWGADKQMNETGYWQKKYIAINAHNKDGECVNYSCMFYPEIDSDYQLNNTQDLVIIRFADILLMAAELKKDAAPMNRVRNRAGLEPVTYSDEALRNERHWELAFEGLRYYDLLRWGIAGETLSKQNGVAMKDNLVETEMDMSDVAKRVEITKGLLPLPKTQIDLSAGVLKQNPGWGNESLYN